MTRFISVFILLFLSAALFANPFISAPPEEKLPEAPRYSKNTPDSIVQWQGELKERMGELFMGLEGEKRGWYLFGILGLSFLYGVVHAAGPGHRKTIIFSLFLGNKTRWWETITAGFFSAGLHGLSALVLILALQGITRTLVHQEINKYSLYFEGFTYVVLFIVALVLLILKIPELTGRKVHSHAHDSSKGIYSTLAVSSLYPCPGAIMILMLSLAIGKLGIGALAIIAMSLGMGVTVSLAAILARTGRAALFEALKKREKFVALLGAWLEAFSYLFLLVFSLWAVLPFLLSL